MAFIRAIFAKHYQPDKKAHSIISVPYKIENHCARPMLWKEERTGDDDDKEPLDD